ncbi:hypothetical protein HY251_09090 [bacterium]|nr:hypothetical protein [bacterium]
MSSPRSLRAVEAFLFLLCLATYVSAWDDELGTSALAHFDQTVAIVESGTLSMTSVIFTRHGATVDWSSPDYPEPQKDLTAAHIYPGKAPGLSFLGVAPYFLLSKCERALGEDPLAPAVFERNGRILSWLLASLPAAVAAVLLLRLSLALGARLETATLGALTIALATPFAPFASALYPHAGESAALAGAGLLVLTGETSGRRAAGAGFLLGLATAISYQAAFAVIVLGAALLVRARSTRPLGPFVLGGLPWLVLLLVIHHVEFGAPWRTGYGCVNPGFAKAGLAWSLSPGYVANAVLGLTVLPRCGLLFFAPVAGAAVLAAALELRREPSRDRRIAAAVALGFFALTIALTSTQPGWWGGKSSGPRYLVPALPLLAPFAARAWQRWPNGTAALAGASLSNALAVLWVTLTASQEDFRSPLFQWIYWLLLSGKVDRSSPGKALGLPGLLALVPYFLVALPLAVGLFLSVRRASHEERPASP